MGLDIGSGMDRQTKSAEREREGKGRQDKGKAVYDYSAVFMNAMTIVALETLKLAPFPDSVATVRQSTR